MMAHCVFVPDIKSSFNIILHLDESKTSQIVSEYIRETADSYQCIPNLFEDDDTLNIKVTYNNRPEHVRFLYYCAKLYSDIFGNGLFDFLISSIAKPSFSKSKRNFSLRTSKYPWQSSELWVCS